MRRALFVLALALVGCVSGSNPATHVTLQVRNDLPLPAGIYVQGRRIGTAYAASTSCIRVHRYIGAVEVFVRPMTQPGYRLVGVLDPLYSDGWVAHVTFNETFSSLSLEPGPTCR